MQPDGKFGTDLAASENGKLLENFADGGELHAGNLADRGVQLDGKLGIDRAALEGGKLWENLSGGGTLVVEGFAEGIADRCRYDSIGINNKGNGYKGKDDSNGAYNITASNNIDVSSDVEGNNTHSNGDDHDNNDVGNNVNNNSSSNNNNSNNGGRRNDSDSSNHKNERNNNVNNNSNNNNSDNRGRHPDANDGFDNEEPATGGDEELDRDARIAVSDISIVSWNTMSMLAWGPPKRSPNGGLGSPCCEV